MRDWLQRSVKEESIIIHHNQRLCGSFRTDELLTRGGHGGDEDHMRVKCDVYQLDWLLYKTFSAASEAARATQAGQGIRKSARLSRERGILLIFFFGHILRQTRLSILEMSLGRFSCVRRTDGVMGIISAMRECSMCAY